MSENTTPFCPDCDDSQKALDRRNFIRVVGGSALALAAVGTVGHNGLRADEPKPTEKKVRPAEDLIKELFTGIDADQKKQALMDYNEKGGPSGIKRLGMYNSAAATPIGKIYTKPQQELIERIVKSMASDEKGYEQITRNGTWDASKSLDACGAHFFGDPTAKGDWCFLFSGHHLTIRADGKFNDGVGFGGPIYYGHTPNGYSDKNCFFYQTKRVLEFYDALDEKQKKNVVATEKPEEQYKSVQFRKLEEIPGIAYADLTKDQKALVESVMRDVLSPFRKEDGDEVMSIVKDKIGMDKVHLAFYKDAEGAEKTPWSFWRLEGPGFVWNYRVLPHVHCYVNIGQAV